MDALERKCFLEWLFEDFNLVNEEELRREKYPRPDRPPLEQELEECLVGGYQDYKEHHDFDVLRRVGAPGRF